MPSFNIAQMFSLFWRKWLPELKTFMLNDMISLFNLEPKFKIISHKFFQ